MNFSKELSFEKFTFELKKGDEIIQNTKSYEKSKIEVKDLNTLGEKIDHTIKQIQNTIDKNVMPIYNATKNTLLKANEIRAEIIDVYKSGPMLSGVEILPLINEMKRGYNLHYYSSTLENNLPKEYKEEIEKINKNNELDFTEKTKLKDELLTKIYGNKYIQFQNEKDLSNVLFNLDKQKFELENSMKNMNSTKSYITKLEILKIDQMKQGLISELGFYETQGLKLAILTKKLKEQYQLIYNKAKVGILNKVDMIKTNDFIDKIKANVLKVIETSKDFKENINYDKITKENYAEKINDTLIRNEKSAERFILNQKVPYDILKDQVKKAQMIVDKTDSKNLQNISREQRNNYYAAKDILDQKEFADNVGTQVFNTLEILDEKLEANVVIDVIVNTIEIECKDYMNAEDFAMADHDKIKKLAEEIISDHPKYSEKMENYYDQQKEEYQKNKEFKFNR